MTLNSQPETDRTGTALTGRARAASEGVILGVPVGALGWFQSLLMGGALGFAAFFAATFVGIMTLLVLNTAGHQIDYAIAYKRIGLPVGLVVGVLALGYLGVIWVRRKVRAER